MNLMFFFCFVKQNFVEVGMEAHIALLICGGEIMSFFHIP